MARVKSIAARKHRKILKRAKGFKQSRSRRVKVASEAVLHAGQYAYHGRKLKKRDLRSLWIIRISAALKTHGGPSYSRFISLLKKGNVVLDRKILSEMAIKDPEAFKAVLSKVK